MHHEWFKAKKVVPYYDRQLWIEMLHTKNWINAASDNLAYALKMNENEFGIQGKIALKKDVEFFDHYCMKKSKNLLFFSKSILKRGLKIIVGRQ